MFVTIQTPRTIEESALKLMVQASVSKLRARGTGLTGELVYPGCDTWSSIWSMVSWWRRAMEDAAKQLNNPKSRNKEGMWLRAGQPSSQGVAFTEVFTAFAFAGERCRWPSKSYVMGSRCNPKLLFYLKYTDRKYLPGQFHHRRKRQKSAKAAATPKPRAAAKPKATVGVKRKVAEKPNLKPATKKLRGNHFRRSREAAPNLKRRASIRMKTSVRRRPVKKVEILGGPANSLDVGEWLLKKPLVNLLRRDAAYPGENLCHSTNYLLKEIGTPHPHLSPDALDHRPPRAEHSLTISECCCCCFFFPVL
ncbi:hypothetical protein NL676_039819 [Syzygium grande]|nr:hypothetical protein NL676_039819 [Syzygium grande]